MVTADIWADVVIVAVGIAIAAFVVLLVLIVWGRRSARPYWEE